MRKEFLRERPPEARDFIRCVCFDSCCCCSARARRYLSFIGSGFRTYSWRLIGGWVRVQNNSFETICFGRPRVAIHRSSALGSASTVGGSSVAGFLYIITFPRNCLGRFKCQPRDYCTVKCPRCRPRLLLRNEPGRLARSVIV